jgi:NitT/TauT family transport system substrate-binding protein
MVGKRWATKSKRKDITEGREVDHMRAARQVGSHLGEFHARSRDSYCKSLAAICLAICLAAGLSCRPATAADKIRLTVQKTGTFSLELAVIKDRGLDREADLDLEVTEVASPEANKIALMGGSADVIVTDWLWVSRERGLGRGLAFYPFSSNLGALMVPANSPIKTLPDLAGKKIAVAGGPLDKSWLLLQAYAARQGLDFATQSTILYGAPALLAAKARQGEVDATLNFWNFCAGLQAQGFRRVVAMEDVEKSLGATGPVAMVGYVFDEDFAAKHRDALNRFFAITQKAKDILTTSDATWSKLAPMVGIADQAELAIYRKTYVDGIPRRPITAEAEDARKLYQILAETGGAKLVGPSNELAAGTFYTGPGVD